MNTENKSDFLFADFLSTLTTAYMVDQDQSEFR